MPDRLVDTLLMLALALFWVVLTIYPRPLLFIWQTEQRRLGNEWEPSRQVIKRLRLVTSCVIAFFLVMALLLYTGLIS